MFKILNFIILIITLLFLNACNGKLPGGDARKFPADPKKRVEQNLKEGRGFRLMDSMEGMGKGGNFDFASSNELWRASLDTIDFMPLASVNYSGGIIITDWYTNDENSNESIKISIRFLTNEIRADALDIKVFNRKCTIEMKCKITEVAGNIEKELRKKILQTAALYKKDNPDKKRDYKYPNIN